MNPIRSSCETHGWPAVSRAAHPFSAADVGTYLVITSGTNWIPGTRAKILSVDGSFIATLDTAVATVGGAVDGHAGQDFGLVTAVMGGYLDGYYIVQKPDSNTVYLSQPLDGMAQNVSADPLTRGSCRLGFLRGEEVLAILRVSPEKLDGYIRETA